MERKWLCARCGAFLSFKLLYRNKICQLCRQVCAVFSFASHALGLQVFYGPIKDTAIPPQRGGAKQKLDGTVSPGCGAGQAAGTGS